MKRTIETTRQKFLRRNVGGIDRAVRIAAGVILASRGLFQMIRGDGGELAAILGFFILVMASIGLCPLYIPFGISTARMTHKETAVQNAKPGDRS